MYTRKYLKRYAYLLLPVLVALGFFSACDWALPTDLKAPTWNFTLNIPIINKTYPLSDLAYGKDSLIEMSGDSLYVSFSDSLETVTLGRDNFFIPTGTDPLEIAEEAESIPFAPIAFGPETVTIPIPREIIIPDTAAPLSGDSIILGDVWNALADTLKINDSTAVDIPQETQDEIDTYFSAYSIVIDTGSAFHTLVENNSPGIIETIQIALMVKRKDGTSYFLANHATTDLASGDSFDRTTDLSGKRIENLELILINKIILKQTSSSLPVDPALTPEISISSEMSMNIKEIRGLLKEVPLIDTTDVSSLPSGNDTKIISGTLDTCDPDTNRIYMNFDNTFPVDIKFLLQFNNFRKPNGDILVVDTIISNTLNIPINLNGYTLASLEEGEVMEDISYRIKVDLAESQDTVIFPISDEPLGNFDANIEIHDFQLASLSGIFNLEMPTPPTAISIPTGMTGIGIAEPSMELTLENGIGLPIELGLSLTAKKLEDTLTLSVNPRLNYPQGAETSAKTTIVLNHLGMNVYWDGVLDPDQVQTDPPSLADLINLGPDSFIVNTNAAVIGEGTVAAGRQIKGSYVFNALFKILPDSQIFLPDDYSTIEPWDSSTAEQILSTASGGLLTSKVISRFPMKGRLVMLMSDSTIFPENRSASSLEIAGVDSISGDTLFFNGSSSWVDTMFQVLLPTPVLDPVSGAAIEETDTTFYSEMSYQTIERLAENKTHFSIPKIELYGSNQVIWIRSSDYITIQAFLGFNLKSDGIFGGSSDESDTTGSSK